LKKGKQLHSVAFVLGNGSSRTNLNHKSLTSLGSVYACNAMYREFSPHFLVAVDVKMVNEIIASGYHRTHQVWTNPNKGVSSKSDINFFSPHKGWSSGPTALHFACKNGHQEIYIFGFDYKSVNGKFNNVYADTFNYKKSSDAPTFFGNWLSQTEKTIKEFKNVKFYRVMPENSFIPDKLLNLPNLTNINFLHFERIFPNTVYSGQKE
jgi:ankyrin repeat protein